MRWVKKNPVRKSKNWGNYKLEKFIDKLMDKFIEK